MKVKFEIKCKEVKIQSDTCRKRNQGEECADMAHPRQQSHNLCTSTWNVHSFLAARVKWQRGDGSTHRSKNPFRCHSPPGNPFPSAQLILRNQIPSFSIPTARLTVHGGTRSLLPVVGNPFRSAAYQFAGGPPRRPMGSRSPITRNLLKSHALF